MTAETQDAPPAARTDLSSDRELIARAVTINRPADELYAYFRDFANLPTFMENVVRIDDLDDNRSHWVVKAPAGQTVEWDATVTEEAGRSLRWQSEEGADVPNSGRVEFRDAGARGTVVTATIAYDPPGGVVGKIIAKLFQREPAIQARRDLRRFKQLMETGEIATAARTRAQHQKEDRDARARLARQARRPRRHRRRSRNHQSARLHHQGDRRPRSAARTCISTTAISRRCRRATSSATSSWARWSRSARNRRCKKGQRVVVPFTIACGSCYHCGKHQYSACDNGLPADNQDIAQELYGQPMSGLFGYSHMTGGYAGGQAEYVRVPFSDVGPIVIPDGVDDDKVLFLSDILPTGWQAAEICARSSPATPSRSGAAARSGCSRCSRRS